MSGAFENVDVAVIGGGISGLAAAHVLRKAGRNAVVLEASSSFGGIVGSFRQGQYLIDRGPQSMVLSPPLGELCRDLGIEGQIVAAKTEGAKRYIYRHGMLNQVPTSPGWFISSRLLSTGAKWRLFSEPFVRPRGDSSDESVASFVTRRAGQEVLDALVTPVLGGIYAGDPAKLSARSTIPALVRFEAESGSVLRGVLSRKKDVAADKKNVAVEFTRPKGPVSFTGGNATLIDALAQSLMGHAYANARVTRIAQRGAGFTLECQGLPEGKIDAGRVVIATSAQSAAALLDPIEPDAAHALREIEYAPIAQIALTYPRANVGVPLDGFGFLACRGEGVRVLGAVWNTALFPERAPSDELLCTAFLGGALDFTIAQLSDEDLARTAHADLCRIMKISNAGPRVRAGFRWSEGIPQFTVGHQGRLERITTAVDRLPGLSLVGNYFAGVGVGDCLRQALALTAIPG
jgi:protoporphyrinogen/coproporphyrinogen III oxidase